MEIRNYNSNDEVGWLRCRVLSFLDTAYYDNVLKEKEKYKNPSIELVAVENDQIVGLLDIEYDDKEKTVCTKGDGFGGMIWHVATHPDFRRSGIGINMLEKAEQIAKEKGLGYLEAWTRDDDWVNQWYVKSGFEKVHSYLHVFFEGNNEIENVIRLNDSKFKVIQGFAHYSGDDSDHIKSKFKRVYECRCYEKSLK